MTKPRLHHHHQEGISQDRQGKWRIEGHPQLRGLLFADRKHATAFLIRVQTTETELEHAMRLAVESLK